MFGWLKRRIQREHRKLAYQNFRAGTDFALKTSCLMRGIDTWGLCQDAEAHSEQMIEDIASGKSLTTNQIDSGLKLNKRLRLLVGEALPTRRPFDAEYAPLGGWRGYWDRARDESQLLEQMRQIRAEIEANRGSRRLSAIHDRA